MRPVNSLPWRLALAAGILPLVLLGCAQTATPPPTDLAPSESDVLEIVGGDDVDVAKFLMRLMAPRYLGPAEPETTQILLGAVPENLPFDLPLPESTIPVGSFVWPDRMTAMIELEVNRPPQAAIDYFADALEAQGLSQPEMPGFGGFESAEIFTQAYLCQDHDFYVSIFAGEVNPEWSAVRIQVNNDTEYGPCAVPPDEIFSGRYGTLPRLRTPPGAVWHRTDGGEGPGRSMWRMTDIRTELTVAELGAHFAPQLEEQGWQRVEQSQSDRTAWSLWTHTDDEGRDWAGILLVAKSPRLPDGTLALFRMDREEQLTCHSSYEPCLPAGIGDFDCTKAAGSYGPNYVDDYVDGPVTVVGPDEFGLDPDGDGLACE